MMHQDFYHLFEDQHGIAVVRD